MSDSLTNTVELISSPDETGDGPVAPVAHSELNPEVEKLIGLIAATVDKKDLAALLCTLTSLIHYMNPNNVADIFNPDECQSSLGFDCDVGRVLRTLPGFSNLPVPLRNDPYAFLRWFAGDTYSKSPWCVVEILARRPFFGGTPLMDQQDPVNDQSPVAKKARINPKDD